MRTGQALVANTLVRLAGSATGVLVTLYLGFINRHLYHIGAGTVGLLAAIAYLVELLAALPLGALSDRLPIPHPRTVLLVSTSLVSVLALQVTAASTDLHVIGLARALEALATAASVPALLALLAAQADRSPALRGRLMAVFEATTALGLIAGPIVGSALWDPMGRLGIALMGLPYAAAAVLFLGVREPEPHRPRPRVHLLRTAWQVLRLPAMRRIAPAWLVLNAVIGLWFTHAVYQMTSGQRMGGQFLQGTMPSGRLSVILLLYALTFSAGAVGWGGILARVGEWRTLRIALLGMLGVCASLFVINHSGGHPATLVFGVLLFVACLLIESGFAPAAVSSLARVSDVQPEQRGLVMGLYSVILGLGEALGAGLGGLVAGRAGMDGIIGLTVALALVASVLVVRRPVPGVPDERP